ncbi:MAG: hypothetical protein LBS89_04040, partial [Zoogloeaceae bacterium]|nr:hypothetical protein [Zoogloeaceae bacterium]
EIVVESLLIQTQTPLVAWHVFSFAAEEAGSEALPYLESLWQGWQAQGYRLVSLGELVADLDRESLPYAEIRRGHLPERKKTLCLQWEEF